jgi:hypothetical protein
MPAVNYPKSSKTASLKNTNNNLAVKEIIKQKSKSYENYNQLKTNVFLRNIQVYFAKQKWPIDNAESNTLRQYYMESLIQFTVSLIEASDASSKHLIRIENVQKGLQKFMPYKVNLFEDVTFFPNSQNSKKTIKSYDLDAFRDSGFHWNIFDDSLHDLKNKSIKNIDPNAAELLVEGIAQMGVLVLSLARAHSHNKKESSAVTYAKSNREKNVFFVNNNSVLTNEAKALGVDLNSNARSASYLDFGNDGDLDIIVNNYHADATILENETSANNSWIKIKLIGSPEAKINRDAIGSSLILNSENHKNMWRKIYSTTGYLSVHPKIQCFGLGTDMKVDINIKWSNGEVFTLKNIDTKYSYQITYPDSLLKF